MRRFAFIVHLRTFEDLVHVLPIPKFLIPILKPLILYLFLKLKGRFGFLVRSKFKIGENLEGYILLIYLTGEQLMSVERAHRVRERILEAVLYAQNKLKCNVIGLGALTSSVTEGGEWLLRQPEVKTAITHGDSFSVYVSVQGIQEIAKTVKLDLSQASVAIIGATGIVGEGLVYQLAPKVKKGLLLIGRNSKKLEAVRTEAEKLGSSSAISLDIEDVKEADIIITATSWPKAVIGPRHLKEGAIIYEVSQPRNAAPSILNGRSDVLVIDGAYSVVPKDIKFWWMSLPSHITFACMAETVMQAMEGDLENHVGKIDPDFIKKVQHRAEKYGFHHAPFTCFNQRISSENFQEIAKIIKKGGNKASRGREDS